MTQLMTQLMTHIHKPGRTGHDAFDEVGKPWNEPLNINLSNHDLNPIEDFEEA